MITITGAPSVELFDQLARCEVSAPLGAMNPYVSQKSAIHGLGAATHTVLQLGQEARTSIVCCRRCKKTVRLSRTAIEALRSTLSERRVTYMELLEERGTVKASLSLFDQLADLNAKKAELQRSPEGDPVVAQASTDLSSKTLDLFAQQVATSGLPCATPMAKTKVIGDCKFCGAQQVELIDSHILRRWYLNPLPRVDTAATEERRSPAQSHAGG